MQVLDEFPGAEMRKWDFVTLVPLYELNIAPRVSL
jgi:hypothetical protein